MGKGRGNSSTSDVLPEEENRISLVSPHNIEVYFSLYIQGKELWYRRQATGWTHIFFPLISPTIHITLCMHNVHNDNVFYLQSTAKCLRNHYRLQFVSVFMTHLQVSSVSGTIAWNCRVISKLRSENKEPECSRYLNYSIIPAFTLRASGKPRRISANRVGVLGTIRTRRF